MRKNPMAKEEIEYTFSSTGIEVNFGSGHSTYQWQAYRKFKETEHLFLLYSRYGHAVFIPKRAMSVENLAELRNLLEEKIATTRNE